VIRRYLRLVALVGVLAVLAAGCAQEAEEQPQPGGDIKAGGVIKMGISADVDNAFDPAKEYSQLAWSIFNCCLLRTLLQYNGLDADEGGSEVQPDLATDLPEVSDDGLTYTFTIKDGVTFAPPFEDVEITSADFVRAIERETCSVCHEGGYAFYYTDNSNGDSLIEGIQEFAAGDADSISGVQTPDDKTLVITLTEPAGDFPLRMAMPAMAPIPEGAAEGHDKDYGRFLVASGPYMFEGSDQLDFSVPAKQQKPVAGYDPGRSWLLEQNPSWNADTDDLRSAYLDGVEVQINESSDVNFNKWEAGEIDYVYDGVVPADLLQQYATDPELKEQLKVNATDGLRYLSMNIAEPPFDDVHVRKAMNFVIDKDGLRRTRGGELYGPTAGHIIPDTILGGVLEGYDPYPSEGGQGDVEAAKAEMMQSKYDTNQDGICDAPECKKVSLIADREVPYAEQNALIADNAAQIGIDFRVGEGDRYTFMYDKCLDPSAHAAFCPSVGWFKDYGDAFTFGPPILGSVAIGPEGCCNYSLVGASPEQLADAGYKVTDVPSLDQTFAECATIPLGDDRNNCWAEADRTAMEEIVPFVPWIFDNEVRLAGPRIVNYTYSSNQGTMALQHVALAGGGA
jgi:peptide/nickel transport system substrate-binding protein